MTESLDPALSDRLQFIQLVTNLFRYLDSHPQEFKFLEQYYSSPFGTEKKREKFFQNDTVKGSSPFVDIFYRETEETIKNLPQPLYHALTFGPVIYLLRDSLAGLVVLDESIILAMAEACWDAIKV